MFVNIDLSIVRRAHLTVVVPPPRQQSEEQQTTYTQPTQIPANIEAEATIIYRCTAKKMVKKNVVANSEAKNAP